MGNFTGKAESVRIYCGEWKGTFDAFCFEDGIGDLMGSVYFGLVFL